MATSTLIPIEEYLSTVYRPDCDYLNGELEQRNVGEREHGRTQGALWAWFYSRERQYGIQALLEQRVQIAKERFRIPDVCVLLEAGLKDRIVREAPFLCIEVLSPEDRLPRMQSRIQDYLDFGVAYVWVVDPETRWAGIYTNQGFEEVTDGILRTSNPEFLVPLAEIFEAL